VQQRLAPAAKPLQDLPLGIVAEAGKVADRGRLVGPPLRVCGLGPDVLLVVAVLGRQLRVVELAHVAGRGLGVALAAVASRAAAVRCEVGHGEVEGALERRPSPDDCLRLLGVELALVDAAAEAARQPLGAPVVLAVPDHVAVLVQAIVAKVVGRGID